MTRIEDLIARYGVLLFDAYGVLVRSDGAIDGAATLIDHLNAIDKPYFVLTNDSSRLIESAATRYRELGLKIPTDRVITSGSLLTRYIEDRGLVGARALVLGEGDALDYARRAKTELVPMDDTSEADVIILGELTRGSLARDLEILVTVLIEAIEADRPPHLVVPNPDMIYPRSARSYGLTSGSAAAMIEAILAERYPGSGYRFDRLGKPHAFIYEEGLVRAGADKEDAVMIGDQLATDVRGAIEFGMDAALVTTGLSKITHIPEDWPCKPTWLLKDLSLGGVE